MKTQINSQVKCNDKFKQKIKVADKRRDTFAGSPEHFTDTDQDLTPVYKLAVICT